jgi:hypothetical protein
MAPVLSTALSRDISHSGNPCRPANTTGGVIGFVLIACAIAAVAYRPVPETYPLLLTTGTVG